MKKETYRITKIQKSKHMWVDKIQGQQELLDYISDKIHDEGIHSLVLTFVGMKEEEEEEE